MQQTNISSLLLKLLVISLTLISLPSNAIADNYKDKQEKDTTALLKGVQVMADLVGATQMMISDKGQAEIAARINLKDKIFPTLEIGYGKAKHHNSTTFTEYKTAAPYARIGLDYNILKNKHDIYKLFVGGRYAYTKFNYSINMPNITDPVWKYKNNISINNVKANYHWAEIIIGADAPIWNKIRMGWTLRYKKRIKRNINFSGNAWYVPGYGIDADKELAATLYISIAFD